MIVGRYYRHFGVDPYFNMAFDEWMFGRAIERPGAIYVRTYSWREGTITVGFNQTPQQALALPQLGDTPLIRRVSGGRALFHDRSELTYAVALNLAGDRWSGWVGSVSKAYERLAGVLRDFLRMTGVDARLVRRTSPPIRERGRSASPPCFASAARYEIVVGEAKVVASAQRQVRGTLLQHGAVKLAGLAHHPALPGLTGTHRVLQPLDRERFDDLSRQFRETLQAAFNCRLDDRSMVNPADLAGLTQRIEWVRSCPLGRRDSFEQFVV